MDTAAFSEWLGTLSISSRIAALALMYSNLTVGARQMFVPDWTAEKKRRERALEILHGLNEIHHTLSNQLLEYLFSVWTLFLKNVVVCIRGAVILSMWQKSIPQKRSRGSSERLKY